MEAERKEKIDQEIARGHQARAIIHDSAFRRA
jgi:hypothetical protein